jgi:hypothetical protein
MLWKRGYANQRAQIALETAETSRRVAFEKSRVKPEDASPLAARPTFRDRVAAFGARIMRFLSRLFGFDGTPKYAKSKYTPPAKHVTKGKRGRVHVQKITPPRGFGSNRAGRKLSRKIKVYAK